MKAIGVAASISGDKFATRCRIDALAATAHAHTLLSSLKHAALDGLRVRLNVILVAKAIVEGKFFLRDIKPI